MPPRSRIRFAEFAFDAATGELWRDGTRVPLQRQPSRLLELLVARPGEVIGRDEIRLALWGRDTHVDFDRSLNFCVAKLRSALGDNAAAPRFVETVPSRGYRFTAAVRAAADSAEQGATDHAERTEHGAGAADYTERTEHGAGATDYTERTALGTRATDSTERTEVADRGSRGGLTASRAREYLAYATVALVVFVVGGMRVFQAAAGTPKVVVVPFHNETGSPELDRLAKGVSDATVVKLAESNRLRVIGNASGLVLSFRPRDMKAMGESLGAQYLVLGQMKRDDRRMRVVAHLIRVSDQTHLWARTYDTDTLDLPQQSSIAEQIAAAVAAALGKG